MSEAPIPRRSDRVSLYLSCAIVVIGAVITLILASSRLAEVAPGHDIPVTVPLADVSVGLPLGPHGATVTTTAETVTVTVADPAPATLFALWAEPLWGAAVAIAGLVLAAVFFLRVARGRVFTTRSSALAVAGAVVVAAGWLGGTLLTNMTTNGALAAISDHTYDSVTFQTSLGPAFAILLLGGLAAALQLGERLQRDTEGLI